MIALGPMSIAVAYLANVWWNRRTLPARLVVGLLLALLGFEASLAVRPVTGMRASGCPGS